MSPPLFSLEPATVDDADFCYHVLVQAMKIYAVQTWGHWNEAAARSAQTELCGQGRIQRILMDGHPAGTLRVDEHPMHHQLEQLFLLPAFQRLNLGAAVLQHVQQKARQATLPVHLRVLRVNPAQRFYARHGFTVFQEEPERLHMRWNAPPDD
ncbi:GNAT family N-acetyltransferase [uncultured Pseudacidovorax sp.]|uniref:GNAT family N-acetyltransferase n=1 Tax=uncultured Pseudacidovorax sp. TaxID=679313 RepID=UPI0025E43998|nr:GNAT family N-acetyltransferase [uncultured Pseudacidovorax sp.]